MEHKRWSNQWVRWPHSEVDYLAAVGGALECRGVAVCVSGTMYEEGGIVLALVGALEMLVCVCQEVLLTESRQRLHGERWGGQEMERLEDSSLHAQLKGKYVVG